MSKTIYSAMEFYGTGAPFFSGQFRRLVPLRDRERRARLFEHPGSQPADAGETLFSGRG